MSCITAADVATAGRLAGSVLAGVDVTSMTLSRSLLIPETSGRGDLEATDRRPWADVLEVVCHLDSADQARAVAGILRLGAPYRGEPVPHGVFLAWQGWCPSAVEAGELVSVRLLTLDPHGAGTAGVEWVGVA